MPYEIQYYHCPKCGRTPHVRITSDLKDQALEIECEFCLHIFNIDEGKTPQVNEADIQSHPITRRQ